MMTENRKTRIRRARILLVAISSFLSFSVHYILLPPGKPPGELQQNFPTIRSGQSSEASFQQNILLYVTTHMSPLHFWYLKACWPPALSHSSLLRNADVMVHMTVPDGLENEALWLLNITFNEQNLTVQLKDHVSGRDRRVRGEIEKKQNGAMASLTDAAKNHWFDNYDWIIRLNPDVIVRNDTFLVNTIYGDENATALLIDCYHVAHTSNADFIHAENEYHKIHTDFFALKPSALPPDAFLIPKTSNAEKSFTEDIRDTILKVGGHRLIPGAQPLRPGKCKVGFGRTLGGLGDTPITHYHPSGIPGDLNCPIPF